MSKHTKVTNINEFTLHLSHGKHWNYDSDRNETEYCNWKEKLYLCLEERLQDMKYKDFENIISPERMRKYNVACGGNTSKAMTLYRYNLRLSQEMFVVVSCFEVALRNRIDAVMKAHLGNDWLRDLILPGGALYCEKRTEKTRKIIEQAYNGLMRSRIYSHAKLLSEMEFGVWKHMFSNVQYRLSGRKLMEIFPNKPKSTQNHKFGSPGQKVVGESRATARVLQVKRGSTGSPGKNGTFFRLAAPNCIKYAPIPISPGNLTPFFRSVGPYDNRG